MDRDTCAGKLDLWIRVHREVRLVVRVRLKGATAGEAPGAEDGGSFHSAAYETSVHGHVWWDALLAVAAELEIRVVGDRRVQRRDWRRAGCHGTDAAADTRLSCLFRRDRVDAAGGTHHALQWCLAG